MLIVRLLGFISCLSLLACANPWMAMQSRDVTRQCTLRCDKVRTVCNKVCHNNCRECSLLASRLAQCRARHYENEQRIKGSRLIRQLNSWRDPLQCRKITCSCLDDYQVCVQACRGVIPKTLRQQAPSC